MFAQGRSGFFASILFLVAACGGGGGGGSSTPPPTGGFSAPPTPTAEDTANANSSQLKMELRSDTRELTITWTDTFTAETTYTIEARPSGGTWQTLDTLAPSAGTGNSYQWRRVIDSSRNYRVSATKTGYAVPLANAQGQTEITVSLPAAPMSIEIDQTEPVRGTVQLSLANAVDVRSVVYYVDLNYIDNPNTGPQWISPWNSETVGDGEHALLAVVQQNSGATVEVRRTITVDNPGLRVSLFVGRGGMWTPNLMVHATVTSESPVQQVEFFVNDGSLHIATAPIYSNVYEYEELNESQLPSGNNVFKVVVTDINGATVEATKDWLVDRAPTLTLTTPADGALVENTVHVEGSFADDLTTVATLTARLGSVQILSSSTPGAFSTDYSLTGLPPGEYTLSLTASDGSKASTITRRVIIPPSGLTYERVASELTELLAVDQGAALYRKTNGAMVVRSAAGVETTLQMPTGLAAPTHWQLSNGYVVMHARTAAAPFTDHIYAFAPNGQVQNISAATGSTQNHNPVLRGNWVAWHSGTGVPATYRLHNLSTDATATVALPVGALLLNTDGFDLVTTPGAEQLLFPAQTASSPSALFDVFRYNVQTQITDLLTGGDGVHHDIQTDNTRVAWLKGGTVDQYALLTAAASTPSATTTLVSPMSSYTLRDGMIAWYVGTHLRANDGTTTRDLTPSGGLYSVGDGRVLFSENGRLMLSPTTGGKQTLLYSLPVRALHDNDSAFITTGSSSSMLLYRLTLP